MQLGTVGMFGDSKNFGLHSYNSSNVNTPCPEQHCYNNFDFIRPWLTTALRGRRVTCDH